MKKDEIPLEYIEHEAWFYGRRFYVDENVLIPRPETAQLIELVKKITDENNSVSEQSVRDKVILDVGTGSGILAITLALELPNTQVTASDISLDALEIAEQNATSHNTTINFIESDLLKEFGKKQFDIIIANLPYVDKTWKWVNEEALSHEPAIALYADDHGLTLIKKFIQQVPNHLSLNGHLILELDPCQMTTVKNFAQKHGFEIAMENSYALALQQISC